MLLGHEQPMLTSVCTTPQILALLSLLTVVCAFTSTLALPSVCPYTLIPSSTLLVVLDLCARFMQSPTLPLASQPPTPLIYVHWSMSHLILNSSRMSSSGSVTISALGSSGMPAEVMPSPVRGLSAMLAHLVMLLPLTWPVLESTAKLAQL